MDYKTVASISTIKEELLKNPHKADEFDRVWKQIYNFYYYTKKFDIHKIKSQERWDEFFKNIDKKLLKSIKYKAVLDPELWAYGSISQDKDIQGAIMTNTINPTHEEKDEQKSSDFHDHHALAHSSAHREVGATPVASTTATPITTNPIIITKNTPAPAAVPIQIITQIRTPVSQILANTAKQSAAPLKILTPQMAKNPAPSQPIQLVTQTRAPISTLLSTSARSPAFQEPKTQSIIVTGLDAREIPLASPPGDMSSPLIMPRQRFSPPQPTIPSTPHTPIPHGAAGGGSRSAGGSPGIPGSMGKLASTAVTAGINALPGGVVVTTIWKNKKVIAGLLVFLLFFFSTFFNENTTLPAEPKINKTVQDDTKTVDNPPEVAAPCIVNPLLCEIGRVNSSTLIAWSNETSVLGTTTQDSQTSVKGLLDIFLGDLLKSEITYSITASYPAAADDIIVTDPIPITEPNSALFIAASGICHVTKNSEGRVIEVWWSVKENIGVDQTDLSCTRTGSSATPSAQTPPAPPARPTTKNPSSKIDITRYTQAPYFLPPSTGSSDIQFSQEAINNANTLGAAVARAQPYLLKKLRPEYTDPFLAVMWTMAIEGSGANPYFWNCNEDSKGKENISKGCRGWYNSGNWQVGYGIQVSQAASHLAQDFKEIYGSSDASKVQEVGNKVLRGGGITNPPSMPAKTVEQLVSEAGTPGTIYVERPTSDSEAAAQQAIAILLMDPAIGAAAIAQEVAGDIGNNWAATMRGWGQSHYTNGLDPSNPVFSNRIRLLAEKYTGTASGGDQSGGTRFSPMTFKNKILPLQKNKVLTSSAATVEVIGGRGIASDSAETSSDGSTLISGDIKKLFPSSLPADSPEAQAKKQSILQHFKDNPRLIASYKSASAKTKIPWQVFAGMHWREGDALPGYSLTSGVRIGGFEPDRSAAGECNGPVGVEDGKADTNCAYATEVDDIMFAANHLIGKINKVPSSYEEAVQALSRYNGTANENCGRSPYSHCPPSFTSEDSAYTLNYFDSRHGAMYMIYCNNNTPCGYGTQDGRPGALTVTKWVSESIQ